MKRWLFGPSQRGWALLLLVLVVAALLRLWRLDALPPGLYRDEAYNGLDAWRVLQGEHSLFFTANNGREPAYIYLTALAVAWLGRTVLAARLAAAVVGTLTTLIVFLLARSWFGRRAGLFSAWLWAVTLWPVHLSRIGLRPVLLAPLLALTFWLATLACRRNRRWLWVTAGLVYGASFYTYLAARFTPLLLLILLSYLMLSRVQQRLYLLRGLFWFGSAALLALLPLGLLAWRSPELFLGRAGQVTIFNMAVNGGDLWATWWRNVARVAGMFLWRGDTILRHNPQGRPVFDFLMVAPFLIGLLWLLRRWRRLAAFTVLSWLVVMLGPTVLAEDAPHFLRAAGVLPALLFVPALGLSKLWEWPTLPGALRRALVLLLALGTLIITIADYAEYARQPDTSYLFEAAARDLAEQVNEEPVATDLFVDRRFWDGWPSVRYLVIDPARIRFVTPAEGLPAEVSLPAVVYAWPYESLAYVPAALSPPAVISVTSGPLARGDLEQEPYALFIRYEAVPLTDEWPTLVTFGEIVSLRAAAVTVEQDDRLRIDLCWSAESEVPASLASFVHVLDERIVGQSDQPLAQGFWRAAWWQPDLIVCEQRAITLREAYNNTHHQIAVGLYDVTTRGRLPAVDATGDVIGDTWLLEVESQVHEEK